jgi:hypothetical protein
MSDSEINKARTEVEMGLRAIVKVRGFTDARRWIERLVREGVVKCHGGDCDACATHVYWQDQAEWYPLCEAHREHNPMWSGSTRWNPQSFGINLLPDVARKWYTELDSETQARIQLSEYDKTNYFALIGNHEPEEIFITGTSREDTAWLAVAIYPLSNGQFAYEIRRHFGYITEYQGIVGMFADRDAALIAAREGLGHHE